MPLSPGIKLSNLQEITIQRASNFISFWDMKPWTIGLIVQAQWKQNIGRLVLAKPGKDQSKTWFDPATGEQWGVGIKLPLTDVLVEVLKPGDKFTVRFI
jgi:hypothetical protein